MSLKQTALLVILTLMYLAFELSFNARLLDVVGGAASKEQIRDIEVYGRTLSGVAVALVVLQRLLAKRSRTGVNSPSLLAIGGWCAVAAALTFYLLQVVVDEFLVEKSSPETRRLSGRTVLLQSALINRSAVLDGLEDDSGVFAKPEGKAFLALFPMMALSVAGLEEKSKDAIALELRRQVAQRIGGPRSFYNGYREAFSAIEQTWQNYRDFPAKQGAEIKHAQDKAWRDYLAEIGRRGWTPSSVPQRYRAQVVENVRRRVSVSRGWHPADEKTFRESVELDVRRRMREQKGADGLVLEWDGSLVMKGEPIPPRLDFESFFARPAVQRELRSKLSLPSDIAVLSRYTSEEEFKSRLYWPMVDAKVLEELRRINAPAASFADGGANAKRGIEAARAVLVPPVALFFSLCGAIGHMAKLAYLLVLLVALVLPGPFRALKLIAWVAPVALIAWTWSTLSAHQNDITETGLYRYMQRQIVADSTGDSGITGKIKANVIHVVAVGQGYGYPVNEAIRVNVLRGIEYGYRP